MNPKHWLRFSFLSALILLALSIPGAAAAEGGTLTSGEEVSGSRLPERISAGLAHTCGIKTDGSVACWGAGTSNTGTYPNYGQAMQPSGTFLQVSAGG
ncbi:MAG: RCC1 domain-containing protein, partial [Chloroflexi bacterium]|nr:RCC1 domain-containing protein [Chloroflexota bacterium]